MTELLKEIDDLLRAVDAGQYVGTPITCAVDATELLRQVRKEAQTQTDQTSFKVGDRVRSKRTGDYLGKITAIKVVYEATDSDGYVSRNFSDQLELAPQLDAATVWSEVPLLIMREINGRGPRRVIFDFEQKSIRHQCYRLLGGNGVKVTDEVKERVRLLISQVAAGLGIEVE